MATSEDAVPVQVLTTLGFNETEALVYCDLLKNPGSTGYRVARSINKAQANTYQTLNSLVQKGAAVFEEGETRSFRATPPEELLARLRRNFEHHFVEARTSLARLQSGADQDERIYQLRNPDQVVERARAMLAEAEETVTLHWFPSWTAPLRESVEAAVGRGVRVAIMLVREQDTVEGARNALSRMADRVLQVWPADPLLLVVDGRQFLLALAERGGGAVRHGYWGRNRFLAAVLHNALSSDIVVHDSDLIPRIGGSIQQHLFGGMPPGFRELMDVGDAAAEEPARLPRAGAGST